MRRSVLAMIMAGGEGTRLSPLTLERAKPAVPFGGKYRIIDFVLSNFINSGINSIFVVTQFKSQSLTEHIINGWNTSSNHGVGNFIIPVPAQMQTEDRHWYSGTADCIHQNLHLIEDFSPDVVAIFGGDHIYRMDVSQLIDFHEEKDATVTVAAIPVPVEEASEFGVIQVDEEWRIVGFQEKPKNPQTIPGNPKMSLVSMGNYIFNSRDLVALLKKDAKDETSSHDFGKNILPSLVPTGKIFAYNFHTNTIPGRKAGTVPYWKDVGGLKAYYEANMDLRATEPQLDLYNERWPIFNYNLSLPPAKFVHNETKPKDGKIRVGRAVNSIVSAGCIISGSDVIDSVMFNASRVHSYSKVEGSILLNNVKIGENCIVKNAIIDKHNDLPDGTKIGVDRKDDEENYTVVDLDPEKGTWLTIVPKRKSRMKLPKAVRPDFGDED
ncbi:MAG: glucose-1-phosphate adenylyltransferase [bacterium]|nr:glucose-1-phosphate adenylyltransferase [bacterium]